MKDIDNTDKQISDFVKSELAEGPRDPDFTRKVMNRLPDNHSTGRIRRFMMAVYIIASVIALTLFIHITSGITLETLKNPMVLLTYFGMLATFFTTMALSRSKT